MRKKLLNSTTYRSPHLSSGAIHTYCVRVSALVFCFLFAVSVFGQKQTDYTHWVNPFIGTGGHGHTYPGATVPHGMVQLSPDTRLDNWDGSSGYHYSDSVIYGFSHTHLSGTGIPDYCDILVRPFAGNDELRRPNPIVNGVFPEIWQPIGFSHANEKAEPGYYSVKLDDGVLAELTTTARVGLHRYTFPAGAEPTIAFDLKWRDKVLDSGMWMVSGTRIEGFRRSSSWAKDQVIYFVAEFSRPFSTHFEAEGRGIDPRYKNHSKDVKATFGFQGDAPVMVKVALSPTGIEGARKNLAAELPGWNFEKVRAAAKATWNKELGKIEVSGGTPDQMTNFYTALYHTAVVPNIFSDVDGKYMGMDRKVHTARGFQPYTVFSLWDTFRAAHPLYTIIDQKRTVDYINTFLDHYDKGGRLPVWELAGNETDCMIGYHAVSVIADAMAKGIKGFDYEKAYQAAKHSAELDHFGLAAYKRRGYISMEDENESVSKTLEYAYDDACIAWIRLSLFGNQVTELVKRTQLKPRKKNQEQIKDKLDDYRQRMDKDIAQLGIRANYFENLFDRETGFMRPRQNGGWVAPFQPNDVTFNFTEGNSWQYSFFVPHNVLGLIELHGGKSNFEKKLDELFSTDSKLSGRDQPDITGLIGQYAHGNEPSHHIAYLYNYVGKPWKTQRIVRKILDEFYKPTPDGLIGNEDCGQMSAWYALSAMGFYPVDPGQEFYDIGTPVFKEVRIHQGNGKSFIIRTPNASGKNIYVRSAKLNGSRLENISISHSDIIKGGVLEFEMAESPVEKSFFEPLTEQVRFPHIAVPVIAGGNRIFKNATSVTIYSNSPYAKIFYTLDGSDSASDLKQYTEPFSIEKNTTVKAIAKTMVGSSLPVEATFHKMPHDWSVQLLSKYNRQYTGGGPEGLIDGIRGTVNFASGEWQGYQSQDFVAMIDLKKETEITELGGGFLQVAGSWIWMPTRVEFETSLDGTNFTKAAEITTDIAPENMERVIKDYKTRITPIRARYVRVKATNLGKIPAWHPGAGFDAFIFVDEIFIK